MKTVKGIFQNGMLWAFLVCACLMMVGCYDDSDIRNTLDDHESRLTEVERLCREQNSNIVSLQNIIAALEANDVVVSVAPVMEGGVEVGYTIVFSQSGPVTIYNGKDGADGEDGEGGQVPVIGVKADKDGTYFWTLDGEWLADDNGNKIPVTGKDGADGKDGKDAIAPKLKIEEGYWYISYDNGKTWTRLEKATGEAGTPGQDGKDGDAFFKDVDTSDPDYVLLTLADGTVVKLSVWKASGSQGHVSISLDVDNDEASVVPGESIVIRYTLENATEKTLVTASSDGKYAVSVEKESQTQGKILVTAPKVYADGYVNVMVSDGEGYSFIRVVNFYESEIQLPSGIEYMAPAEGGEIRIPLTANFGFEAESLDSWIAVENIGTKAEMQDYVLKVKVGMNEYSYARKGTIRLKHANTDGQVYDEIIINQSSAYFTVGRTHCVLQHDGGSYVLNVTSSRGLSVSVPESAGWLSVTDVPGNSVTAHELTIEAAANDTGSKRFAEIVFFDESGSMRLGTFNVIQLNDVSEGDTDPADMIFEVKVNFANLFTAQLPLWTGKGVGGWEEYGLDCYVDWGDGTVEHVTESFPSHVYEGLDMGQVFEVKVSGNVAELAQPYSGAITNLISVKQWGNTGLTSLRGAFNGCTGLRSIAGDKTGSFAEVDDFASAFEGCTSLEAIPEDLFAFCPQKVNLNRTFFNCSSVEEIPEGLFNACLKCDVFDRTFFGCTGLTSVPEDLFAMCTEAKDFNYTFYRCTGITEIPAGLFASCREADVFAHCFDGCTGITEVPEDLFSACTKVSSFGRVFSCTGLTSVPENLFASCQVVKNFASAFWKCVDLVEIPEDLFASCSEVEDFSFVFDGCQALSEIPEDLFAFCPEVKNFCGAFRNCYSLNSIPASLFDNNRKVADFSECFKACGNVSCETPYTMIGDTKVHLYERENYPDYFVAPDGSDCFIGVKCADEIPAEWK